jgi:hypothetical protein
VVVSLCLSSADAVERCWWGEDVRLYTGLTTEQLFYVCDSVKRFFGRRSTYGPFHFSEKTSVFKKLTVRTSEGFISDVM